MQTVKDQTTLARAFVAAMEMHPELRTRLRLIMVGDGPLRQRAIDIIAAAGLGDCAWLPGERTDIPEIMRGLNCFVLPSMAEGISNTILEAMASGLPVIATAVGGNTELVIEKQTGLLIPPSNSAALAQAIVDVACNPENGVIMGHNARRLVEERYSLSAMVRNYQQMYDRLFFQRTRQVATQ
jgi:glycosyltransferase involved in cell wall biosynthesis